MPYIPPDPLLMEKVLLILTIILISVRSERFFPKDHAIRC